MIIIIINDNSNVA